MVNVFFVHLYGQNTPALVKLNEASEKFINSTPHDSTFAYWEYATELDSVLFNYLKTEKIDSINFKNRNNIFEIKSFANEIKSNNKFKFVSFETSDNASNGAVSDHLFVQWTSNDQKYHAACLSTVGHLEEMYLLNAKTILIITSGLYSSSTNIFTLKNNAFVKSTVFPKNSFDLLLKEKETHCENFWVDSNGVYCTYCKFSYTPVTKTLNILTEPPFECSVRINEYAEGTVALVWTEKEFKIVKIKNTISPN